MKWFRHMSNASNDEFIANLESKFGLEGYARWWKMLEIIAAQMDETNRCYAEYPWAKWQIFLGGKRKKLETFLEHCRNESKIFLVSSGNDLKITCPNLLKLRDFTTMEYRKREKKYRNLEVEVEVEVNKKEKEKEKKEKETDARTPSEIEPTAGNQKPAAPPDGSARRNPENPDSDNSHFEKVWAKYPSKDGKKAAERHYRASVKSETDRAAIETALKNYIAHVDRRRADFPGLNWKNGSTWFNNWRDWVNRAPPETPRQNQLAI